MTEASRTVDAGATKPVVRTFLIADVRGYTRFTNEQGVPAAARLADRFAVLCKAVVSHHQGEVIELRGDEALSVFSSPRSAVLAAVELQGRFQDEMTADPTLPLRVGMGLDVGEVIPVQGGYRGRALNLAARLCSLAAAGEAFSSEDVVQQADRIEGLAYVERGNVALKGFEDPIRVILVLPQDDLPENFPPLVSLVAKPSNLPLQATPFIGRRQDIEEIAALILRDDVRLLTLTGPGGTGKTRLALQVGGEILDRFERGVFFVNLAPLSDPSLVASTIAATLKVREAPGHEVIDTLSEYLQDRQILLVLDNFEHLLDAAGVVHRLLGSCPRLSILVTSRAPLHLSAEHEYLVSPLAVPDLQHLPDLQTLTQYEALRLFIERAQAVKPSFAVTNQNAPAVAEICYRLDGLPLAIELAATRIKLFPPDTLLKRLSSRLTLLTGGARDLPARQRTLRNAIDWSYTLLSPMEQTLFARLSVFAGGCTYEAAEAVCSADGAVDVLEGMTSLVEASLLRQQREDEARFQMLETIQEYAAERLEERGEGEVIREMHAAYFLEVAEEAEPFLGAHQDERGLAPLMADHDNLRRALDRLLDAGKSEEAARLATALWRFWAAVGTFTEGRQQLEAVLALPGLAASTRTKALLRFTHLASHQGMLDQVQQAATEALTIARETGDLDAEFEAVSWLWSIALQRGNREQGRALYDECMRLAPRTGDREHIAQALRMQGFLVAQDGDYERAGRIFVEEAALRRDPEVGGDLAGALINIGWAALQRGNLDDAHAAYAESLAILGDHTQGTVSRAGLARVAVEREEYDAALPELVELLTYFFEGGFMPRVAECLEGIARIVASQGHPALAGLLIGAADTLQEAVQGSQGFGAKEEPWIEPTRSVMGRAAWDMEYDRGRALPTGDAVQLVLQYAGERSAVTP